MAQQRLVVLGAAEARLDRDLREGLDSPQTRVELIRTERRMAPEEWDAALDQLEETDTALVVVSAAATTSPAWIRLVEHAVASGAGLVVVDVGDVDLTAWPVTLRDARPPVVDLADPGWLAGAAALVGAAHADRPPGWSPPARPTMPDEGATRAPRRAPAGGPRAGDPTVAIDEDVQFTLYRPASVSPRRWHWLLLFAHKAEGGPELDDPLGEVRRQAEAILGDDAQDYGSLTADSSGALRRGTTLLIEPWLDGATFNPPTVELQWHEPVHRADFRFQVGESAPAVARGGVRIFAGVVLIGELTMAVRVATGEDAAAAPQRADRFRRIFASYAHTDAEVVERLAAAVSVLGDEYIIDSRNLRSGEDWEQRIEGFIEQADVFQLFWSTNALRSPHVLAECRHALALDREGFIRPVVWEDPFPQDVDRDLPPAPIRRLHFSRLSEEDLRSVATGVPPPPPHPPPPPPSATPLPPPAVTADAARGPLRPSSALPPTRTAHRRSKVPLAAAALVALLGVGAGAFALQGGGGNGDNSAEPPVETTGTPSATPPTTLPGSATSPTVAPTAETSATPPPSEVTATQPPVTEGSTTSAPACDSACLRAAFAFMDGGECLGADLLADLESNAELCLLTSPSGGQVRFRGVATATNLDVAGYLEQLGRRTAAQVSGEGRWQRDGVEQGPYADFTWTAPEDPYPACRAWGEDGSQLVGWVCAADAATALELWEAVTS